MKCWHIYVRGLVQGVGFRRFTQKKAEELGLKGWVRNLRDSRVEIKAIGEEKYLKSFYAELRRGPHYSKVEDIQMKEIGVESFTHFEIRFDGDADV